MIYFINKYMYMYLFMFLFMTFWWIITFSFITDALEGFIHIILLLLLLVVVMGLGGKKEGGLAE